MVVVGVGAHDGDAAGGRRRPRRWRRRRAAASMTMALVVVADDPDVVLDVPGAAVEAENVPDGRRGGRCAYRVIGTDHHRAQHVAAGASRANASSTSSKPDRLGDESVEVKTALEVAGR